MKPKLLIEPFYGGSHKQLIDLIRTELPPCDLYTLPAKKWPWRARVSALYFSQNIPLDNQYELLFCSSVLNLSELVALRPDLAKLHKVVYFHENQLAYPVRKQQDRDFQYGYNQILTCLVADTVVFNSLYNQESFLGNIQSFIKLLPDFRPKALADQIRPKCQVAYFPIQFPENILQTTSQNLMKSSGESGSCMSTHPEMKPVSPHGAESDSHTRHPDGIEDICGSTFVREQPSTREYLNHRSTASSSKCKKSKSDILCDNEQDIVMNEECTVRDVLTVSDSPDHGDDTDSGDVGEGLKLTSNTDPEDTCDTPPLVIVWAHRWEHDKNPELFFHTVYRLQEEGLSFRLAVMGETFTDVPAIFSEARDRLSDHIMCWGYQASKEDYYRVLQKCDVSVSTARHEFYGVAMLESAYLGCCPLVPNDLVYPEIFPKSCLYNTENQLLKKLRQFCQKPHLVRTKHTQMDLTKYSWRHLQSQYRTLLSVKNDRNPSNKEMSACS